MAVTDSRIELMDSFMTQRIDYALRKNSRCITKYERGKPVYFFQLDDCKFRQVRDEVLESMKEYMTGDYFDIKSIK